MTNAPYADLKHITASGAVLYVSEGNSRLREHFDKNDVARIPVLISGHIAGGHWQNQHEWRVVVSEVNVDTDHAILYTRPSPESSHFDLDASDVERLDGLAESTLESGVGILASSSYHGQGQVGVPSHWLRALVVAYRQQNPNSAAFYFHAATKSDENGELIEVRLVPRNHWDKHRMLSEETLSDLLGGRVPSYGAEVEAGLFVYRGCHLDGLLSELYDAGFREDEGFSAFATAL
jgi:hypothetical protein